MIFRKIREAVGPDFIVECLLSGTEPEGGYTLDDTVMFLKMIEKDLDIVQLRGPEADISHPTGFEPSETPFLHYGEYVKKSGVDIKVAVIGGYQYYSTCERAIAEGKADIISMARSWISNPYYGKFAYEGRDDDMVPCIRCNKCHGRGKDDPFVSVCSVNPIIGLEHCINELITPPGQRKRIAVIGGGPAGMKAAIDLCDRGHDVTLFESSGELGGAIKHSDFIDFKWPVKRFKDYLICQIKKRDIKVLLNTIATSAMIKESGYDIVIPALGGVAIKPRIPGIDGENVFYPDEAIRNPERLGKKVVVIGGGEVGVEVGMHIAKKGRNVTVLEKMGEIAADSTLIHYREMFKEAWEAIETFSSIVNATCTGISGNAVSYRDKEGVEKTVPADSVIISVGMKAQTEEALSFFGSADGFYMIGDCRCPGTIEQAVRSAFSAAARI